MFQEGNLNVETLPIILKDIEIIVNCMPLMTTKILYYLSMKEVCLYVTTPSTKTTPKLSRN